MTLRPFSFQLAVPAALLAGLMFTGAGQSRSEPQSPAAKVQEVNVLKNAYVLLAMGDHDYDGHRVKAMHAVEEAIKKLDHSIMKDGTNGQKVVATEDEIKTARAAYHARQQGKVHEGQAMSDLQMREAGQLLAKVHESLPAKKHAKAKEHVGHAIKEVEIALSKR